MWLRFSVAVAVTQATAEAPIGPLAQEPPYATGTVTKRKKPSMDAFNSRLAQ